MNKNTDKMTYVKALTFVLEGYELPEDVRERLTALKASQVKKSESKGKAQTAKAEADSASKDIILEVLGTVGKAYVDEIRSKNEILGELSNQKVSALLRALKDEGKVVSTVEKKRTLYSLASVA
jgi:hypothetical protein